MLEKFELNGSFIYYILFYFMDGFKSWFMLLIIRNINLLIIFIMMGLRNLREFYLDNNFFYNYGILFNFFMGLDYLIILSLRSD